MTQNVSAGPTPRRSFVGFLLAVPALVAASRSFGQRGRGTVEGLAERRGRRIVTGVDAQGRSVVESDQPIIPADAPADKPASADFWVTRHLPTALGGQLEPSGDWKGGNQAPPGGVIGRILTWPSGFSYRRHTTPTMDFIIVISGQLELVLDSETRVLVAGDVAVQRGTPHAWRVAGPDPCTFVGIMLDATTSK